MWYEIQKGKYAFQNHYYTKFDNYQKKGSKDIEQESLGEMTNLHVQNNKAPSFFKGEY